MAEQPKDTLTLTLRLYDPKEKVNPELAASWVVIEVPREALGFTAAEFAGEYVVPAVARLEHFKPKA